MESNYEKLVKALTCGNDGKLPCHNNECPYWVDKWHGIGLCNVIKKNADAADAIEALQAQLPKRGEVVRCGECKWYDPLDRKRPFFCPVMDCATGVMEDDFCSRGERRAKMEVQE